MNSFILFYFTFFFYMKLSMDFYLHMVERLGRIEDEKRRKCTTNSWGRRRVGLARINRIAFRARVVPAYKNPPSLTTGHSLPCIAPRPHYIDMDIYIHIYIYITPLPLRPFPVLPAPTPFAIRCTGVYASSRRLRVDVQTHIGGASKMESKMREREKLFLLYLTLLVFLIASCSFLPCLALLISYISSFFSIILVYFINTHSCKLWIKFLNPP